MLMQSQGACYEIWGQSKENNHEITAEVQSNYPNFKQNLVEKEASVISRVNGSLLLFKKFCLRAAWFKKLTTKALSRKVRIKKQEIFPKSRVFSISFVRKLDQKIFPQREGYMNTEDTEGYHKTHTPSNSPGDENCIDLSQRAKLIEKNSSTSKECLDQTTYLRPNVTWIVLNCFFRLSDGHHQAQFTFIVCATG